MMVVHSFSNNNPYTISNVIHFFFLRRIKYARIQFFYCVLYILFLHRRRSSRRHGDTRAFFIYSTRTQALLCIIIILSADDTSSFFLSYNFYLKYVVSVCYQNLNYLNCKISHNKLFCLLRERTLNNLSHAKI